MMSIRNFVIPTGRCRAHSRSHDSDDLQMDMLLELFPTLEGGYEVIVSHHQRYTSKFMHDDFIPRNVLVETDDMVMAIVDWDSAGGLPGLHESFFFFHASCTWRLGVNQLGDDGHV